MDLSGSSKKGPDGRIFESCDISFKNTPSSYAVRLALFMYECSDSAIPFCHALAYVITAKLIVSAFMY